MEKFDERAIKRFGVTFVPLQGKYALVDRDGNPFLHRFDLSKEQVEAIYKYMEDGLFEGMFTTVEQAMYGVALGYHYDALKDVAKKPDERKRLDEEYAFKSNKLKTYAKGFLSKIHLDKGDESAESDSAGPLFE